MESAEIKLEIFRKLDKLNTERLNEAYVLFLNYLDFKFKRRVGELVTGTK